MSDLHSVTQWCGQLRVRDDIAAQRLWDRYFPMLVKLAENRLKSNLRLANDPEDIALSAFASFCRQVECGRYPHLADRDDLWRLLVTLTIRKALRAIRDQGRIKRGGANCMSEVDLEELVGHEPSPAFATQVAEEFQQIIEHLSDIELQKIALWKMDGLSNPEIAQKLGKAPRTVERKLNLIRQIWKRADT